MTPVRSGAISYWGEPQGSPQPLRCARFFGPTQIRTTELPPSQLLAGSTSPRRYYPPPCRSSFSIRCNVRSAVGKESAFLNYLVLESSNGFQPFADMVTGKRLKIQTHALILG